ncbi:peptide chain release factor N(5)-glutamine methyltransferase [Limnospira fusiformis KN01]|uniref:Release factor glutamine methyltransferase n=1 Tax=Limnospira maxima CS-328 TaxID=513049 RepID=B5VUT2_LIMMA|nr:MULTISPECIES: peptide chain release factor N(5)-glutamine methyltransferase [Limnospira]EKD11345.1 HemK methyltransferase [Arthrospira platensis C1]MBD2713144.1 peptide chain release factor N(5)-glutamine methyltransferase [Arthrospira platensis FACHB-835]MDC0837395.1 peptide chain release factor N(5)-glutamine methyltransferase [Limnoraphis robusta]QJB27531.1 peptide chain release factor N(5)-glutamine methyltransferase [Limnospira fusiformis SAG 85.79]EDZ96777.1 protein-(glutamine-N5) met
MVETGESDYISGEELRQWQKQAQNDAIAAEVSAIELDMFLEALTDLTRLDLRLDDFGDRPYIKLNQPWSAIVKLWERRITERVPLQYLLGVVHWRNFTLKVSPAVLIPRPETELIIDIAYHAAPSAGSGNWVDMGTGSGAIALGLASVFPEAMIHAVDCSWSALAIALENAQSLGYQNRVKFYQGSWWGPLHSLKGKVSGMVANPPYIPSQELPNLQPEVILYEPPLALDGGESGLDSIHHLVQTAPQFLQPGGIWIIEMMAGQGEAVTSMLESAGCYRDLKILPDLAGIDRFAIAYLQ